MYLSPNEHPCKMPLKSFDTILRRRLLFSFLCGYGKQSLCVCVCVWEGGGGGGGWEGGDL